MPNTVRNVLLLIVIVAIAGGLYYWSSGKNLWNVGSEENQMEEGNGNTEEATSTSATLPTGSDASDASLDTDLGAMDTQLNAFTSDNTSVNAGLSDTPTEQSSI